MAEKRLAGVRLDPRLKGREGIHCTLPPFHWETNTVKTHTFYLGRERKKGWLWRTSLLPLEVTENMPQGTFIRDTGRGGAGFGASGLALRRGSQRMVNWGWRSGKLRDRMG